MKVAAFALVVATGCLGKPAQSLTLPDAPPPGPWQVMRESLVSCAVGYGLAGPLQTKVEFDDRGYALSIASSYGDDYAQCVGNLIQSTKFRGDRGRAYNISFIAPGPAPQIGSQSQPPPINCPHECTQ